MTAKTDTKPLRQELEQVAQPSGLKDVFELVARTKPEIERLLPAGIGIDRFERIVRTEIRRTPKLIDADPYSFLGAIMHCAQLGLEPGPLQLIHLLPFDREVQVIVGYRGEIELAYRSGMVKDINAELVYEGDHFRPRKGSKRVLEHDPKGPPGDRDIVAAYAVANLKTGGTVWKDIYEEDWERARKASPSGSKNRGPWVDARPAMILKTAFHRLASILPKSPAIMYATAIDDRPALRLDEMIEAAKVTGDIVEAVTSAPLEDDVQEVAE
jgi:recombination protein RecT